MTRNSLFFLLPTMSLVFSFIWYGVYFSGDAHTLWITSDQKAYQLYKQGHYLKAAQLFNDLSFKASAFFKAGEFKKSAAVFATMNSAASRFNQANSYLMLGKYQQAIETYELAINIRSDFKEALENKAIAIARKERIEQNRDNNEGTGGQLEADEVVYDNKNKQGQDTTEQSGGQSTNVAHWLDRLQTGPKEFLKHKFGYQYAQQKSTKKMGKQPL